VSPQTRFVTHSALYLALAVLLPIGFHLLGGLGRVFLPMHFPVLLAGFLVGPASGFLVGILAPGLSHLLTGMPPSYAVPLMSLELPLYGLIAGLTYVRLRMNIYVSLILAMVVGRLMFALGLFILGMFIELPYSVAFFFSLGGPIWSGLPGIVAQIILVPVIVAGARRRDRR
jgi:uncharacterized membrane protein